MTDRDSNPAGGGGSRRATPRLGDSPQVAEGHDDKPSPGAGESKYPATAPGRPAPEPLKVRIELVVVDGPDAKELLKRQAAVVREALQWFADNPTPKARAVTQTPELMKEQRGLRASQGPTRTGSAPSGPPAEEPPATTAPCPIPVGWYGRVATDAQANTMLARQLDAARRALPPAYTIVATFYDIGSGRLNPQERGRGLGHHGLELSLPRDGGLCDLLAEASRPERRFHAVVCTSIDRIARPTHLSTQIEHELERAGIALLVAEEGIEPPAPPDPNDAADTADR